MRRKSSVRRSLTIAPPPTAANTAREKPIMVRPPASVRDAAKLDADCGNGATRQSEHTYKFNVKVSAADGARGNPYGIRISAAVVGGGRLSAHARR